jgi:glycosyltransferase involved in cell wall biosynthesis
MKSIKQFMLNEKKVFTSYSGFAENQIEKISHTNECLLSTSCPKCQRSTIKIILFRGKYNSEAGIELIDHAASEISQQNIKFVFAISSMPSELLFKSESIVIQDFITYDQMRHLYEVASLCIGQVSENIRLNYTIPHKAFEAGHFGTPYLTRDSVGIREIFPLDAQAIFYYPPISNLGILISSVINDQELLDNVSRAAKKRYKEIAAQSVITEKFMKNINNYRKPFSP